MVGEKSILGDEAIPEIGERIYAIGNPKGLSGTFSEGIVSGVRNLQLSQELQITAPISPGSSGGPVLNSRGQVIGVAYASYSEGQNLNFAIPIKYLLTLKIKLGTLSLIPSLKSPTISSNKPSAKPDIKEGVVLRNVKACENGVITCSIKNNLQYTITDIKVLYLLYDQTGTIVDYYEVTYFPSAKYLINRGEVKPFLAKTIGADCSGVEYFTFKVGYKLKYRLLDFKIKEES